LFLFVFRMVSSYLVHHGYCATAEAFARSTDQTVLEELASIKNRQSKAGKHITSSFLFPSPLNRYCIKLSLKHHCRIFLQHCFIVPCPHVKLCSYEQLVKVNFCTNTPGACLM